jgi:hypothetical protein
LPIWLFKLPVGKFADIHIHWRGDKLAGLYDVNDFKIDVLYKSFDNYNQLNLNKWYIEIL